MPEAEGAWQPIWSRGGKISEVAWVGKEVLAWSSGLFLTFFNVTEKRHSLRWRSRAENPDGICCLSGHPTMHLLAFSDKTLINPKIHIKSYPSMSKVSECLGGSRTGYFATSFASTDNLITLAARPTCALTIWSWRTGERLASIETQVKDTEGQILRVSHGKPTLIGQLGRPSGKLHVWEVSPAGKKLLLTCHEVTLPKDTSAYDMAWSSESGESVLAIVDREGHVYLTNHDASIVHRIVFTLRCGICLEHEAPSICWYQDGIVLRTTFCQIRFFRKDTTNAWRKDWEVKSNLKPCYLVSHPSRHDRIFYPTQEGFLVELEGQVEGQAIERRLHDHGGIYRFADLVHPWGHHLVAIDDTLEASVIDCYDGRQISRVDLEVNGEVTQLLSHPDFPMAAVTSKEGELSVLSLRAPERPFVVARFHLQRERLDLLKVSQSGRNLVVGQRTTGICFCVSLTRTKPFAVIFRVETMTRMADLAFYDEGGHFRLLVLVVSSRRVPVGRYLALYDLYAGQRGQVEPSRYLELPNGYQFLHYAPKSPHSLIATAYLSRQIHLLEVKDWKQVNLVEAVASGHQLRRAKLLTDRQWLTSAGFDGLVTLRRALKVTARLVTHHRSDLGAVKSFAQPSGNVLVALGHDGSLVAMKFNPDDLGNSCRLEFDEYERRTKDILADYASLDAGVVEILSRKVSGFPVVENGVGRTWVEVNEEAKLLEEAEECTDRKIAIKMGFQVLQGKVVELLDENEACDEIERLPISAFDLDKPARDQRLKTARDEIDDVQHELEHRCVAMDRVTGWLRSNFWDTQEIVVRSILPIFGNEEVANIGTIDDTPNVEEMLRLARLYWDPEESLEVEEVISQSSFVMSKLQTSSPRPTRFDSRDERQRISALLDDDDEDREVDPAEVEDQMAKEGTTTHRFVEPANRYSSQFEVTQLSQLIQDNRNIVLDCQRLRDHFNDLHTDMYETKLREVRSLLERHERIRHLVSELRLMFGVEATETPCDPVWTFRETPDKVIRVEDDEVTAEPWISGSQLALLNRRAAEAERLRKIALADDFRERALMRMMDGVLEVRWEDVIKRDVPKPQCMLTKDPEEYNADDLQAIRQYEKEVEALDKERQRYRRLLESDLFKVTATTRDAVERFNSRLREFSVLKMRLEAAVHQLNLRNLRGWLRHVRRSRSLLEDAETREKIKEKRETLVKLRQEVRALQGLARDYRNQHDAAMTKDRQSEKKFRGEFPSLRRIVTETLEREYKRRPKVTLKSSTAGDLVELGRVIAARGKVAHLPHECSEYQRQVDQLDVRPLTLPTTVEPHHWDHLTRLRRNRIEVEMRLKARMAEVHETEKTVAEHEEKILKCQADIDRLVELLKDSMLKRRDFDLDAEIQLVLRMGQVEVALRGRRDDAANAVLIPQGQIYEVNERIVRAGGKKLAAMDHVISFRRGLLVKEWEHRYRRATIADLGEELGTIEGLLVTRDVREYLKRRFKDAHKDDKTPQQVQKELEAMRRSCEKRLREWMVRLEDVEVKVTRVEMENRRMDRKIEEMNVDRWELEWQRDVDGPVKRKEFDDRRIEIVAKRSRLVRILQRDYTELLAMQTEHELLRMRRFPELSCFKTLDDETRGNHEGKIEPH